METMGNYSRQNDTNISEIYIGCPISVSDVRYKIPDWLGQGLRLGLGQRYRTSDIDIGRLIYILDIRYLYPTCNIQYPIG